MASIEYLTKRIAGKEAEIAKLTKKLERINEAKASGWEKNPYYYHEDDLKYTLRDLESAKAALDKYRTELNSANEKAASRNVTVILEFLANWKTNTYNFFLTSFKQYLNELEEYYKEDTKYCDWWNHGGYKDPNRKQIQEDHRALKKAFTSRWSFILPFVDRKQLDTAKLQKTLDQEADAKYDFIIERTNAIVGAITDASELRIGAKGDLNGFIRGTKGACSVKTIGAGGYNIQCFHFRTLIHPVEAPKPSKPEITPDTNFKAMSIDELKELCTKLGATCKAYENEAIYRMRLVMAIKKAL